MSKTSLKKYWILEYRQAKRLHLTSVDSYDRALAFGRSLSLSSVLHLEYGYSIDDIDAELEKEFSNGCTD